MNPQKTKPRPTTIAELADDVASERWKFDMALRNFLHQFYADGCPSTALSLEPVFLRRMHKDGQVYDAFLAATAEYFCSRRQEEPPLWCHDISRFLKKPWYSTESAALRMWLLVATPAAFKKRNLFIPASSLSVA